MNIAQLTNMSFEEFQRIIPFITPADNLTCSDLLKEAIRRVSDVNIHQEAEEEAEAMFREEIETMESEHETIVEEKDDEIATLTERIANLESRLNAERARADEEVDKLAIHRSGAVIIWKELMVTLNTIEEKLI